MTSEGSAHGRFSRAIANGNVRNAEDAARELGAGLLLGLLAGLFRLGVAVPAA